MNRRRKWDATRYQPVANPQNGWRKGQSILTEAEKMVIRAARRADWNYTQIARLVAPSFETVRRFCQSEGIGIPISEKMLQIAQIRNAQRRKHPLSQKCAWCGQNYRPRINARTPTCSHLCAGAWRSWKSKGPPYCAVYRCLDCGKRLPTGERERCSECARTHDREWHRIDMKKRFAMLKENPKEYARWKKGCRERSRRYAAKHPELIKPKPYVITCPECGRTRRLTEKQYQLGQRYCSTLCSRRVSNRRRNMFQRGAFVENVSKQVLFERDHGRCQICGRKVHRQWTKAYDPLYWTIDHIVALSNGGVHSYDNTQLACHECNTKKGASQQWAQLLLA